MDFSKLTNLYYLIDYRPTISPTTLKAFIVFFSLFVIIAIGIKIAKKYKKYPPYEAKLLDKYFNLALTFGLLGLLWSWFRYETVPFLSSRLIFPILIIMALAWLYPIIRYQLKTIPEVKKKIEAKKIFQKYLPKKK